VRPGSLALQQGVQDPPQRGLCLGLVSTDDVAGGAQAVEEGHVDAGPGPTGGQVGQVQVDHCPCRGVHSGA